jgi:hypothetical protein
MTLRVEKMQKWFGGLSSLAMLCLFSSAAFGEAKCPGAEKVKNNLITNSSDCKNDSNCVASANRVMNIADKYIAQVNTDCNKMSSFDTSIKGQGSSQGKVKDLATQGSGINSGLMTQAQKYQEEALAEGKKAIQAAESATRQRATAAKNEKDEPAISKANSAFGGGIQSFSSRPMSTDGMNDTSLKVGANLLAARNASQLVTNLNTDISERQAAKKQLDEIAEKAGQQETDSGAGKEKGGMDPSTLASLAGLAAPLAAMMQKSSATDTSSLSSNTGTAAAPPVVTLGSTAVSPVGAASRGGGASTNTPVATSTATTTSSGPEPAYPGFAAHSDSGLSNGRYADAFTGMGGGSSHTPISTGGSAGSGSGGSSGAERTTASATPTEPHAEEALASFGGGGLNSNFNGNAGSSGSPSHDEPVKDFLQNAENLTSPDDFAAGGDGSIDSNPEQTGVEGEDGKELFRRVRASLERAQKKGLLHMSTGT